MAEEKLITTTAKKESSEDTIGLTLNYYDGGKILIRHVFDDGIFHETTLKAGQILVSVNGKPVKGMSTVQAMELFTENDGDITIVSEDIGLHVVSITKDSPGTRVGIGLKDRFGRIIVSNIAEDGMFANTDISLGQQLISVNGTSCVGLNKRQAVVLFKELEGLTVMTADIGYIAAKVTKSTKDAKVGVGLRSIKGHVIITSLSDSSLFQGTAIKPGLRLLSVNNTECAGLDRMGAIQPFKDAESDITVMADDVGLMVVSVKKDSKDSKVGIGLKTVDGRIIVSSIAEDGLFADTNVVPGLRLLCIGNTLCANISKTEAIGAFKEAEGTVTVICEEVGLVSATATKESQDSKVGIGLRSINNMNVISSISPGGLFADTELKIGHKLVSVNKVNCSNLTKTEAINLFKDAEGEVTVMAEEIGIVTATATKESADSKVGIGLKDVDGDVIISCVYDTGLFAKTKLVDGLKLLSVNETRIKGMGRDDAIKLFREAEGELMIMALDTSAKSFLP